MVAHPAGDHEQYLQLPPGEPVDFSRVPERLRRGDHDDVPWPGWAEKDPYAQGTKMYFTVP